MRGPLRLSLLLAVAFAVAACQSIGPVTVQRDRLDYANAIASSWREQMLLNVVKLRYFDAPVFLEISSVINSYTLQGEVTIALRPNPFSASSGGSSSSNRGNSAVTGTYTDRPTITYAPVTGKKYIDSLLRPIRPQAIFAMIQGGHPADFILGLSVEAINGIYNSSAGLLHARPEDPRFQQVIAALRRIQDAGALEIRTRTQGRGEATFVAFRASVAPEIDEDIGLVRKTLGIDPQAKELRLVFGAARGKADQITLFTRSMLKILANISSGVDVPKEDLAAGRATAAPARGTPSRVFPFARIHSGPEAPADAYAAANYHGYWFWIDDRDLNSKRVFTFLLVFSSIAESGAVPQVPIVTIPAN